MRPGEEIDSLILENEREKDVAKEIISFIGLPTDFIKEGNEPQELILEESRIVMRSVSKAAQGAMYELPQTTQEAARGMVRDYIRNI